MPNDYAVLVLEEVRDQNKAVLEAVGQIHEKVETLATQESLSLLEAKVDLIQLAVTDTNIDLAALDKQVTVLDPAAPK